MRPVHEMTPTQIVVERLKMRVWRSLTKKAPGVFLRGGDLITIQPMLGGVHEPQVTGLMKRLAREGYGDFLIDIGANIGLISFQCAHDFSEVYCFEPNPDVFKILSVNCKASGRDDFRLNEFGIGQADEVVTLNVPKGNFGGALIGGKGNRYSEQLLATKDWFDRLDGANYREVSIRIKDGKAVFPEIFGGLRQRNKRSGVIKLDVEGYEETVLRALSATLPQDFQVVVIFENLDPGFGVEKLSGILGGRGHFYKIETNLKGKTRLARLLTALTTGKRWILDESFDDPVGDLVYATRPLT